MEREEKELQAYMKRLRGSVRYFWRAAYAITADRVMAEQALNEALVSAYLKHGSGSVSFRDGVLPALRLAALEQMSQQPSEGAWDGFFAAPDKCERIAVLTAGENMPVQRMSVLRYGCAMTVREIAALMNLPPQEVQQALNQSRLRIERILNRESLPTRPYDRLAMNAIRQAMNQPGQDKIDVEHIVHAVEAEISARRRPRRMLRRVGSGVALCALGALFMCMLWLLAVLMDM